MPKKSVIVKRVLIGLAAFVALFAGVVALLPNTFRVERSATIAAPVSTVFAWVNDFQKWKNWSPWEELDPAMKQTFEGPASGTGASYAWDGNDKVGAGKMTLLESRPDELIKIKLEFFKPFADVCDTNFTFKPETGKTNVTWIMTGQHNVISKVVCLFMSMDKMIGGDFEKGLAKLKAISESPPAQASTESSNSVK